MFVDRHAIRLGAWLFVPGVFILPFQEKGWKTTHDINQGNIVLYSHDVPPSWAISFFSSQPRNGCLQRLA